MAIALHRLGMEGSWPKAAARRGRAARCETPGTSPRRRGRKAVRGSVQRKVRELKRLVPGGRRLRGAEQLYVRTADYILHLRLQVDVLTSLSKLYIP